MQKKLIALAVAGLASTAAFAQSNVTVYGLLDLGYQRLSASDRDSVSRVGSMSSNLWGLKGVEDLGNGMKAGFTLEAGLTTATGASAQSTSTMFGRQSFLFLAGDFGAAQIGRMNTFGRNNVVKYSASPLSGVDGFSTLASAAGFTISGNGVDSQNTGARVSNGIAYVLPTIAALPGFKAGYAHAFPQNTHNDVSGASTGSYLNVNEIWAGYDNGPLSLDYVYHNVSAATGTGITGTPGAAAVGTINAVGPIEEHFLGFGYDFGSVKLVSSYQTRKTQATNTDKIYNLGVNIPVTAADKVSVSYARLRMGSDLKGTNVLATAGLGLVPTGTNLNDASSWAVGYYHSLSKRTTAYTTYTRISNSGNGGIGFSSTDANANPSAGGSTSLMSFGLQHAF